MFNLCRIFKEFSAKIVTAIAVSIFETRNFRTCKISIVIGARRFFSIILIPVILLFVFQTCIGSFAPASLRRRRCFPVGRASSSAPTGTASPLTKSATLSTTAGMGATRRVHARVSETFALWVLPLHRGLKGLSARR